MKRTMVFLTLMCGAAFADTQQLNVDVKLPPGNASKLDPLAFSPTLAMFLVERNDTRPNGTERSWNLYSRALELEGYVVLSTNEGVSVEHVQWMSLANKPAQEALAGLATKAREAIVGGSKKLDSLYADWQKLRATSCPLRMSRREGGYDAMAGALQVAAIEAPLPPADAKRGCSAPTAGTLRCFAGAEGDVIAVVPFKQDCGGPIGQELLVRYNAHDVEYLKEEQLGEQALKKNDLAGAMRHLERSLELDGKYPPARYHHACARAKQGVAFADGKVELEAILDSEDARQKWLPRIRDEACFAHWRADAAFAKWWSEFPTRTPIKPAKSGSSPR
jgi:hypothetical protein